jgi:hypothetical protein
VQAKSGNAFVGTNVAQSHLAVDVVPYCRLANRAGCTRLHVWREIGECGSRCFDIYAQCLDRRCGTGGHHVLYTPAASSRVSGEKA